jgi:predicted PurR-regulated permease PerM
MKQPEQVYRIKFSLANVAAVLAMFLGVFFIYRITEIILAIFFALIIMAAIKPIVFWMERKLKFPRVGATLFVYICLLTLIGLAITVIVPPLMQELPNIMKLLALPPLPSDVLELKETLTEWSNYLPQLGTSFQSVISFIGSAFSGILTSITVLVMASYMILERERLHLKMSWFTKDPHHLQLGKKLISDVEMQLGGWVRGQLSLMLIIGVVTYIGLTLLGIPYAIPLALAAGLLEVLPNMGPLISALPAVAVAFQVGGPALMIFTILFYILVQQFENNLIVPKLMKDNVDVDPLMTIVLILIGFKLGSVPGALLSVPIYIVMRTIYSMWSHEYHHAIKTEKDQTI